MKIRLVSLFIQQEAMIDRAILRERVSQDGCEGKDRKYKASRRKTGLQTRRNAVQNLAKTGQKR
jgi:hypothetical protein